MGEQGVSGDGLHPAAQAEGQERAGLVRSLFTGIAPRYDLVNRIGSMGIDSLWRRRTIKALKLKPGAWLLDVCSGTGDLALAAARKGVEVLGVDFCRAMLVAGAQRSSSRPVVRAEGDALALPVASDSMDAACVGFGIRNVVEPEAGLAEMTRCVRPGGRVAVLEFSRPPLLPVRWVYEFYCARLLPLLGDLVSGKRGTYKYLPQTIVSWLSPDELAEMMRRVGLVDVCYERLTLGIATLHVGVVPAAQSPC